MRTLNKQLIIVAVDRKVLSYMASSVSGQDEAISAEIEYPNERRDANLPARDYPLCPARKNSLLAKIVQSKWLDIGLMFFCEFMDFDFQTSFFLRFP